MPMQRYEPEQIVTGLRQIEVAVANRKSTPQACKEERIVIEQWRWQYNTAGPRASLGYKFPPPGAYTPVLNLVSQPRAVM